MHNMHHEMGHNREQSKQKLKCTQCDFTQPLPTHCGQGMHQEGDRLVCWMGASCGQAPIPQHHGKPMKIG